MAECVNRKELLDVCRAGRRDQAMELAFRARDRIGMLLVSVFDVGSRHRLGLLLDTNEGAALASEIVLVGIDANDHDDHVTKLAYGALDTYAKRLPLAGDQADAALDRLALEDDPIAPDDAARVFIWVAAGHGSRARFFACRHVADATVSSPPDALGLAAADLLGASADPEDHAAVLSYAEQYLDAGNPRQHGELVGRLRSLTNTDVTRLIAHLSRYSSNKWPPRAGITGLLKGLTLEQIRTLGSAVPDTLSDAWFTNHLLPSLFATHAERLADTLSESWWPDGSLTWLLTQAVTWSKHNPALLGRMLRSVRKRKDVARARQAHTLIRTLTVAADSSHDVKSAMPRLGARLLLGEALAGSMEANSSELITALSHLEAPLRLAEYEAANWRRAARARRMAQVIANVDVDELVELIGPILALRNSSRHAFVAAATPHLTEAVAAHLAGALGDDTNSLAALAKSATGADAVLARWQEDQHLPSFRALASTRHRETRLNSIPELMRDYTRGLTGDERRELLDTLPADPARYKLLLNIVGDWGGHPGPNDDTLIHTLDLVAGHLRAGADPSPFIEAGGALCRQHSRPQVRRSAYAALGVAEPTTELTDLLRERVDDETKAMKGAVRDAIATVTTRLIATAKSDDPHRAMSAVIMLGHIQPEQALPFARRFTETATSSEDRIRAIQIVAQHGHRSTDPGLLRRIVESDTAHPDRSVRAEAERGIRRLEIGDLHAAHERLGELAGRDPTDWNALDPTRLFGTWGEALQAGLDRVAENESSEMWGQAIDQLGEVAKVLLYRAIELAGTGAGLSSNLVSGASANRLNFGDVLGRQQLLNTWSWAHHFAALYNLRTEHVTQRGSQATPPRQERDDLKHAFRLFRDGAGPCCGVISANAP